MRRSTLTFGLGVAAVAAVAVAPRLSGLVVRAPQPEPELQTVVPVEAITSEVVLQLHSSPEPVVPEATVRPRMPVVPLPPRPTHAIEMKTSASSELPIPELNEPRRHVQPQPPVVQPIEIDIDYWDDCPACGMG